MRIAPASEGEQQQRAKEYNAKHPEAGCKVGAEAAGEARTDEGECRHDREPE
jgi:hypothetical protein